MEQDVYHPNTWTVTELVVGDGQDPEEIAADWLNEHGPYTRTVEAVRLEIEESILDGHRGNEFHRISGTLEVTSWR